MNGEKGSVTLVMLVAVGLVAVMAAALGGVATVVAARQTAQMAADAAALAAAPVTFRHPGSALETAGRFAAANGARLVECTGCGADSSWNPRVVQVRVSVEIDLPGLGRSSVSAVAAAEFDPVRLLGAP